MTEVYVVSSDLRLRSGRVSLLVYSSRLTIVFLNIGCVWIVSFVSLSTRCCIVEARSSSDYESCKFRFLWEWIYFDEEIAF